MAKDDYFVVVFKILTYLYSCLKGRCAFDKRVFIKVVEEQEINDEYLMRILKMMESEGLIDGLCFAKAWGNTYILASDYEDMKITVKGIEYLTENSTMNKIKKLFEGSTSLIGELIQMIF